MSVFFSFDKGHSRGSSYNNVCAFVQPESSLETSLVRQSSLAHANPLAIGRGGGASPKGVINRQVSTDSVEGYVDTIVDDQYVVIEPSPSGSGSSVASAQEEARSQLQHPVSVIM